MTGSKIDRHVAVYTRNRTNLEAKYPQADTDIIHQVAAGYLSENDNLK